MHLNDFKKILFTRQTELPKKFKSDPLVSHAEKVRASLEGRITEYFENNPEGDTLFTIRKKVKCGVAQLIARVKERIDSGELETYPWTHPETKKVFTGYRKARK